MYQYLTAPSAFCDFNMVDSDQVLPVLRSELVGLEPAVGERLLLQDADGNLCYGIVSNVASTFLDVHPVWESWRPAELRFTPTGGNAGPSPATATLRQLIDVA